MLGDHTVMTHTWSSDFSQQTRLTESHGNTMVGDNDSSSGRCPDVVVGVWQEVGRTPPPFSHNPPTKPISSEIPCAPFWCVRPASPADELGRTPLEGTACSLTSGARPSVYRTLSAIVCVAVRPPTNEGDADSSVATCRTTQSDNEFWVVTIDTAGKENSVSKLTWALEPRARWPSFFHQRQMLVSVPVARRPPGSRNLLLTHSAKPSGPRPRPRSFTGMGKFDLVPLIVGVPAAPSRCLSRTIRQVWSHITDFKELGPVNFCKRRFRCRFFFLSNRCSPSSVPICCTCPQTVKSLRVRCLKNLLCLLPTGCFKGNNSVTVFMMFLGTKGRLAFVFFLAHRPTIDPRHRHARSCAVVARRAGKKRTTWPCHTRSQNQKFSRITSCDSTGPCHLLLFPVIGEWSFSEADAVEDGKRTRQRGPRSRDSRQRRLGRGDPNTIGHAACTILHSDVRGFISRVAELGARLRLTVSKPSVLCLTETWADKGLPSMRIEGYTLISGRDRADGRQGGGVAVFALERLAHRVTLLENSQVAERSWVITHSDHDPYVIG